MILVCGPSKVGKTSNIAKFTAHYPKWHHVVASQLLLTQGLSVKNLSVMDAYRNQTYVKGEIEKIHDKTNTVFDGHLLVPLSNGFFLVEPNVFGGAPVSDIIFVSAEAKSYAAPSNEVAAISIEASYSRWMAETLHSRHHNVCGSLGGGIENCIYAVLCSIQHSVENKLR